MNRIAQTHFSSRAAGKEGLLMVVALHIALAWALMHGLGQQLVSMVKPLTPLTFHPTVEEPPKPTEPPPLPTDRPAMPTMIQAEVPIVESQEQPMVPPRDIGKVATDAVVSGGTGSSIGGVIDPPPIAARPTAQAAIVNVHAPSCQPDYPAAAARAEATGVSSIRFTVNALGRVIAAQVVGSSGATREHRLLDQAAQAALARCPITPGRDEQGRAIGTEVVVNYSWTLN